MTREEVVSLRQRLLDHSFQPVGVYNWNYQNIPQKVRGKRPSEPNWQNTVGMPVYRDDALNTGILTGTVYPLDIDVEDQTIVTEIVTMAETLFGRTIVRCRQNSPRRLLPYRIENPDARKIIILLSCGKLEFLGRGQQFVGFGKHPSGADYEWQGQPLDEIEINELPVIDAAGIRALAGWAEERWPVAEKMKPNGAGRKNGAKADFRNTCFEEDVEAALKQLPCDYDYRKVALRVDDHRLVAGLDQLAVGDDELVQVVAGRVGLASFEVERVGAGHHDENFAFAHESYLS
jgi:hypothetical protein